jgi:transposase
LVDVKSHKIICTAGCEGKTHDFKLFQESGITLSKHFWLMVDSGYQGIQKCVVNALLPKKKSKHNPLTKKDKIYNRLLSQARILIENIIGKLKRFRIIADKYRNRRKRFQLRFNLIAAIHNMEI